VVLDPTGTPLREPLRRDEGILYAEIDLAQCVEPKQFHDVVGSYNRFDIFTLLVDRSPRPPATFLDEVRGPGDSKARLDRKSGTRHGEIGPKPRGPGRRPGASTTQTDESGCAGPPQGPPADLEDRGEDQSKSGGAAWFGEIGKQFCFLALARFAVLLGSVLLALLLFRIR
jgi:hypothetical protein